MVYHGIRTEDVFGTVNVPTDPRARRIARRIARERQQATARHQAALLLVTVVGTLLLTVFIAVAGLGTQPTVEELCRGHEGTTITVPAHTVTDNPDIPAHRPVTLGC